VNHVNHHSTRTIQPGSFQERGVAVPFTAPMLASARVRPARRGTVEIILPNPSGERGFYVLTWAGARELCRPTLNDTLLADGLAALPLLSPVSVRRVARDLAAAGHLGEDGRQAALTAAEREAKRAAAIHARLMQLMEEQLAAAAQRPGNERQPAEAVVTIAGTMPRQRPGTVSPVLELLSHVFVPAGLGSTAATARLPGLIGRLRAMSASIEKWAETHPDPEITAIGLVVADCARTAAEQAEALASAARSLTRDMPGLLRAWLADPSDIAAKVERPDWILDGWDYIALLWESAVRPGGERSALLETAQLLTPMPRELTDWLRLPADQHGAEPAARVTSLGDGWRSGSAAFALVARNERLRILAL
jgi:hypothetical protein